MGSAGNGGLESGSITKMSSPTLIFSLGVGDDSVPKLTELEISAAPRKITAKFRFLMGTQIVALFMEVLGNESTCPQGILNDY